MAFFFDDHRLTKVKITKTITATAALVRLFGNHAEAQADLSMAIDGRQILCWCRAWTVLPTALYGLSLQIFGYFSTGKHLASF